MKVLVTGGAGYIGSHSIIALIEAGHRPVVFDNFSNSDRRVLDKIRQITGQTIEYIEGDCRFEKDLDRLKMSHPDIAAVIHFAALKSVSDSVKDPLAYFDNNLSALINVLAYCKAQSISNFVFSSSAAVYGESAANPVQHSQPLDKAASPYALTKQMGEQILENTVKGEGRFRSIGLRYFNPVGAHPSGLIGESPNQSPGNLVPVLMDAVRGVRPPLQVFGTDYDTEDGTCIRDYLHVMDLAEAHVAALERLIHLDVANHWEVLNLGTGKGSSVLEVLKTFARVNKIEVPHVIAERREGDLPAVYADTSRAAEVLGWRSQRALTDSLEDAWRFYCLSRIGTSVREWGTKVNAWFL